MVLRDIVHLNGLRSDDCVALLRVGGGSVASEVQAAAAVCEAVLVEEDT